METTTATANPYEIVVEPDQQQMVNQYSNPLAAPVPAPHMAGYPHGYPHSYTPAPCGWSQAVGPTGKCEFSGMAVLQSVFALPSKIVEPALMSLPVGLVPIVGLAVNAGAWWLVWRGVEKYWLGPMTKGNR